MVQLKSKEGQLQEVKKPREPLIVTLLKAFVLTSTAVFLIAYGIAGHRLLDTESQEGATQLKNELGSSTELSR